MNIQDVTTFLGAVEKAAWRMRRVADETIAWRARGARLSRTSLALARIVGDYRLYAIYSAFLSARRRAETLARIHRRSARLFFRTSAEQLGAFLKIGQMLSARPDLLPAAWIEELATLQDAAPAVAFADLAGALADGFASVEETPLAAASIGQVHRAVTRDGADVAVKVRRPGIAELVEHDLALLEVFVEGVRDLLPPTDLATILGEVRAAVVRELDYEAEARSMTRAADFFAGTPGVIVPRPLPALSGPERITTPFVAGIKISTWLDQANERERADVLGRLLSVYLRQVLHAGEFQADPHPGNFLCTPAGELVLLDFGCTCTLSDEKRRAYRDLVRAFISGERARVGELCLELGFRTRSGAPDTLLAFADALLANLARGGGLWPTRDQLLAEGRSLLARTQADPVIAIPTEFVMIGRVFGTLGGLFQHHRPAIDLAQHVLPAIM